MFQFLMNRLWVALLVGVTVTIIGFSLLRLAGDLAAELAGEDATPQEIADTAKAYGLDRPFHVQYLDWVGNLLQGDLGRSLFTNEPVIELILERVGVTIKLAVYAIILGLVFAVPLAVIAAVKQNSWVDRSALTFAVFGQAVPSFWLGLMLILIFGVWFRMSPISGSDTLAHFILPTITLSTFVMPSVMRLTRSGMLDVLESDYIRTARAKGLSPGVVMFKHALRNAILPVVSLATVNFGFLLGGSVAVETVFAMNGLGLLAFDSIVRQDFPVVQSIVVFVSFVYIFLTLMSDLVNAKLDPRIRLS